MKIFIVLWESKQRSRRLAVIDDFAFKTMEEALTHVGIQGMQPEFENLNAHVQAVILE